MPRTADPTSKSQLIRNYHSANPTATAREIQSGLKKNGVKVTTPLIYNVISVVKRQLPTNGHGKSDGTLSSGDLISLAALLEAKKFIEATGSIDEAKRALNTLAKLR